MIIEEQENHGKNELKGKTNRKNGGLTKSKLPKTVHLASQVKQEAGCFGPG